MAKNKEILKKFELPERKSKIATLMKQSDEVYCICRSTDSISFMIACDNCEEWFHGACIGVTKLDSNKIKSYFCPHCCEANPGMRIIYKKSANLTERNKQKKQRKERESQRKQNVTGRSKAVVKAEAKTEAKRGRRSSLKPDVQPLKDCQCKGCSRTEDCGECLDCTAWKAIGQPTKVNHCLLRKCLAVHSYEPIKEEYNPTRSAQPGRKSRNYYEDDNWAPERATDSKTTPVKKGKKVTAKKSVQHGKDVKIPQAEGSDEGSDEETSEVLQCNGPGCQNGRRPRSKFCSDVCGVNLSSSQLYHILPARLIEYNLTPSVADAHNERELTGNREKALAIQVELKKIEKKRNELEAHITEVQGIEFDESNVGFVQNEDGLFMCCTCAHEFPVKNIAKHIDKCYGKFENKSSFGSFYKTNVEGPPLFCDFYTPTSKTYCKRLAVLCTEHSKDPKISETEICGYRLFDCTSKGPSNMCRQSKKRCTAHLGWEKLSRALLDMERIREYLKLDDLLEQDLKCKNAMDARGGIMALLLNSCFDHEQHANLNKELEAEAVAKLAEKEQLASTGPEANSSGDSHLKEKARKKRGRPPTKLVGGDIPIDEDRMRDALPSKREKKRKASGGGMAEPAEQLTASKLYKRMKSQTS